MGSDGSAWFIWVFMKAHQPKLRRETGPKFKEMPGCNIKTFSLGKLFLFLWFFLNIVFAYLPGFD